MKNNNIQLKTSINLFIPEKYECGVHGTVTEIVSFSLSGKKIEKYCLHCFRHLIRKTCMKVKPIKTNVQ